MKAYRLPHFLAHYTSRRSLTDYFSSLQEIEPVRRTPSSSRKSARNTKFRTVPPLVTAYRPLSGSGTTRNKKPLRPKQEPISPVMSGYGVSWLHAAMSCSTLMLSVLFWWTRKLQLHHCCVSNSRATIYAGTNKSVLRTISVLPTSTIHDYARVLCSTGPRRCWCIPTANHWSWVR
jgi:hypothetical protein